VEGEGRGMGGGAQRLKILWRFQVGYELSLYGPVSVELNGVRMKLEEWGVSVMNMASVGKNLIWRG